MVPNVKDSAGMAIACPSLSHISTLEQPTRVLWSRKEIIGW